MASKSKRARMAPQRNLTKTFMYWAIAVSIIKLIIIAKIPPANLQLGDGKFLKTAGIWLGADGENYLAAYNSLLHEGVFSSSSTLNYFPAGYPLVIFLLSIFGKSWVLTTLSVFQSLVFSFASYIFASQISKTKLKKLSYTVFIFIILNPTLSLASIVVGYESLAASGFLIASSYWPNRARP